MPLPPACKPNCHRNNWIQHPVGDGARYARNGMAIEHKGIAGSILTTCRECGNFIGYMSEAAKKKSDEDAVKRKAKRAAGEMVEVEGMGV